MAKKLTVHLCNYSSHNSLQIKCDDSWTGPKWGDKTPDLPKGVYESDDDRLYSFDPSNVTCKACKA